MKQAALTLLIALISAAQSFAGGIIFYTNGGSSYINAVQYETYTAPTAHLSYITVKGGQRTQIQSAGIIANIPFPTKGTEYSLEDIRTNIAQADAMASSQPKYAQAMQKVSQLWNDQIQVAEASEKQRQIAAAAARKKEEEANKRLAAEAKQKAEADRIAAETKKQKEEQQCKVEAAKGNPATDEVAKVATPIPLTTPNSVPFRLKFGGDSGDGNTFIINASDAKASTQFLKLGDMIEGAPYKLLAYEKKTINKNDMEVNVSELTVQNTEIEKKFVLVYDKEIDATTASTATTDSRSLDLPSHDPEASTKNSLDENQEFPMECTFPAIGDTFLNVQQRFHNELSENQERPESLKPAYKMLHLIEQIGTLYAFFHDDRLQLLAVIPFQNKGVTLQDIARMMIQAFGSEYRFAKVSDNKWADESAGVRIVILENEVELLTDYAAENPPF